MKILNKNKAVLIVLLLSSLTLVSNLFAQQTQNSGSTTEQGPQKTETTKTSKPTKTQSSERVFKPSEEISADSPVPFPVDI